MIRTVTAFFAEHCSSDLFEAKHLEKKIKDSSRVLFFTLMCNEIFLLGCITHLYY